jgi:hypothetical protein
MQNKIGYSIDDGHYIKLCFGKNPRINLKNAHKSLDDSIQELKEILEMKKEIYKIIPNLKEK